MARAVSHRSDPDPESKTFHSRNTIPKPKRTKENCLRRAHNNNSRTAATMITEEKESVRRIKKEAYENIICVIID